MKCLVIGARGFVGVELVRQLLDRGHEVVAMDVRGDMGRLKPYADRITWLTGDCANGETVLDAIGRHGIDSIYYGPFFRNQPGESNLSAEWATMGGGALAVFNLARALPIKRIVFPSSTAVHGEQVSDEPRSETSAVKPFMVYGATKLLCEYFAERINADLRDNRIVAVRLSAIYGPGADIASRGVNIFPVQATRGNPGRVDYTAETRVCIAHVADTARFLVDILEADDCTHSLYELGGLSVSFGEIAAATKALVPGADLQFGTATQVPLPFSVHSDRGAAEFGLRHTPLLEGVRSIVEYERTAGLTRKQAASQTT